jgi:cysteinyl-tRNA synthetase
MTIRLFNTLSSTIEDLIPAGATDFRMYACGPTVYDFGHIGNFRTFLQVDVLRRFLRQRGVAVRHVMNVTDVDDKIIANAAKAGLPIDEYTPRFEKAFFEDLDWLGVERPEVIARATENIEDMVALIERLAAPRNGHQPLAYQTEDGSWYFRIAGFPEYGKLSKKDFDGIADGVRNDVDEYDKDSARDFALWKAAKPREHCWETRIGAGRPGWHIECSAMAMKFLGESFDLHAGGEDLMFPHHENEIAQSESATRKPFARHWFHVRFLLVEGKKMSKSEGNFYTLRDLLLKGYKASAIRFLLISVPYGQQMNFTFEGLAAETGAIDRLRTFHQRLRTAQTVPRTSQVLAAEAERAAEGFTAALSNDLNTAVARGAIFDLVRAGNAAIDAGTLGTENVSQILQVLNQFDQVFAILEDHDEEITRAALEWAEREGRLAQADPELLVQMSLTDAQIDALIEERTQAKRTRNFARADAIRKELAGKGIVLEDSKDGVRWKRR